MTKESDITIEAESSIERLFVGFAVQAQKQMTEELIMPKKRVIVISGPTCVGKTEFVHELAKEMGGEVISADSMQVYKEMNIGTAKPPKEYLQQVPYHLVDTQLIDDHYNVVDFYYEARHACQEILARGGVPIIAGGSGFYIHSLIYGPPSGPPSVPELRKQLEEEIEKFGIEPLYERLRQIDPQYAATITKCDKQKVIRALEIITLSGKQVSRHLWRRQGKPRNFNFRCWFLFRPKEVLYKRIDQRCDEMIKEGLIEEVSQLKQLGLLENPSASQAIGYRQALDFLQTQMTQEDLKRFEEEFKRATRKYAKRQFTWFRKEPLFRWIDLDLHDPEVARDIIRQDYEAR
jgi:tRNA dimethylallyltransferase